MKQYKECLSCGRKNSEAVLTGKAQVVCARPKIMAGGPKCPVGSAGCKWRHVRAELLDTEERIDNMMIDLRRICRHLTDSIEAHRRTRRKLSELEESV